MAGGGRGECEAADAAVITQSTLLELILQQGGVGIIVADAQGTMRRFNAEAEAQHGVGLATLPATEWIDRYQLSQIDGRKVRLGELALYRALQGEKNVLFTYRVRHPDGSEKVISGHANPLRHSDGRLAGAVVISRDETEQTRAKRRREQAVAELRRSEQLIRNILETSHDVLLFLDADGRTLWNNPRAPTALKLTAEALADESFVGLWAEPTRPVAKERLAQAAAGQEGRFIGQSRGEQGTCESWWSVSLVPQAVDDRQAQILVSMQDITHIKRAEAENLEQARFAQQLVGIVSHDLRNPISAILLSATQMSRHADAPARHRRAIDRIAWAAKRANRLIYDLLDFTQSRLGGGIKVTRSRTNVVQLARLAIDEISLAHPGRDIQLDNDGPQEAVVDGDRMTQLVVNLVSNAIQHGPEEGTIVVTVGGGPEALRLSVHNQGRPIPKAMQGRLFEPMQRGGEAPGSGRIHSIGLGLYIVKIIVEAHDGSVEVRSEADEGTTFTARIPRRGTGEETA